MSTSKVAAAIGLGCSKNMVIRALQSIQGKTRTTVTFPDSVWPSTPKTTEARNTDAREEPVHILKVAAGQCRAPLWPDFLRSTEKVPTSEHMLCGHPVKDGSAYCADHHEKFYPTELQKRKPKATEQEIKDNTKHFG
jgi:hypothetical protein